MTGQTLTRDPMSGGWNANTTTPGSNPSLVDLNSGGGGTQGNPSSSPGAPSSPSTIFIQNMSKMLQDIQGRQTAGNQQLAGVKSNLINQSVSPNGPTSFAPGIFSGAQVAGQENLQGAFNPAITSNIEMAKATNASLDSLTGKIQTMAEAALPKVLEPGQSLVTPDGKVIKQGHQYQSIFRNDTGTYDGWDQNTGTWSSQDMSSEGSPITSIKSNGSGSAVIGGIEFGTNGTTKPWASDPNAINQMNHIYNDLKQSINLSDPNGYDLYIKNNGGGPVTSGMIFKSASQYGIDSNVLASVLMNESDFGKSGVASKDNNPGGITFTGAPGQIRGTARPAEEGGFYVKYNSLAQGVNAVAANLAARVSNQVAGAQSSAPPKPAVSPTGGIYSVEATQKLQQLPQYMQQYVEAGPKGVAYVNTDRVPDAVKPALQNFAARIGIPFLSSQETENVKNIGIVYESVKKLNDLVNTTLGSGLLGRLSGVSNKALQFAEIGSGPQLKQFEQYRSQAINNLKALTAGGTTFRITQTEIDTAVANIPGTTDNQETAKADLQTLTSFMDTKLSSTFPYTAGGQPGGGAAGGMVTMTGPKGTYQVSPDKVAIMQQNGYAIQ